MICGKYDSLWKYTYNWKANRTSKIRVQGHFMTAIEYARYTKGGMRLINHARKQPWETWQGRYLYG